MKPIRSILNPNTRSFWDKKYRKYIERRYIRSDGRHLDKFIRLFDTAQAILDFGSGLGGNIQYLAGRLENKRFLLVDQSQTSLDYTRKEIIGETDDRGNRFEYHSNLTGVPDRTLDLVMSIEVLEHITEYRRVLDQLWGILKPGGILLLSVPVLGLRDRTRVHVNRFTVTGMFKILTAYSDMVHISPRTYSKRSGRLSTAYFYVEKKEV